MPHEPYDVIGKIVDLAYTDCPEESGSKILYDWNEHHKIGGASESKSGQQFKFRSNVMRRSAKRSIRRKTSKRKTSRKRSIKRKTSRKRSIKRKTSRKRSIKRKTSRKRSIKRKTSRKRKA
jgi:hypothetical protein